jgi:hypothetical protein
MDQATAAESKEDYASLLPLELAHKHSVSKH